MAQQRRHLLLTQSRRVKYLKKGTNITKCPFCAEVVVITDAENNVDNMVELEVDTKTKYLSLKALQLMFKNATGLKYRNPTTNAFRICK